MVLQSYFEENFINFFIRISYDDDDDDDDCKEWKENESESETIHHFR
jgi:hypothetical protein